MSQKPPPPPYRETIQYLVAEKHIEWAEREVLALVEYILYIYIFFKPCDRGDRTSGPLSPHRAKHGTATGVPTLTTGK
jgi:hypothetical protein